MSVLHSYIWSSFTKIDMLLTIIMHKLWDKMKNLHKNCVCGGGEVWEFFFFLINIFFIYI